ncbi:helix-turn-helix domain-containing protein [Ruminococcus sp.]|uniref:helix-turn-helix domain-containing protein n=1 Tax=Ruminococcus sp. TaxID=41978 RepID=UPI001B5F9A51|nr:helix-turn-helix domain-containing protein [Ruminococcus sp.]MBP5431958.1 helix-turn-helix domain-containing protein [Ruminococcus sp.]
MIVPEKIYKLKLTSTEINIYQYLCSRANKQGECFPSQTTIAKAVNMHRSTVNQAIRRLQDKNLLIIEQRRRDNGGTSSNLYRIGVM